MCGSRMMRRTRVETHESVRDGYKATRWLDLALAYRHLEWDFSSTRVIDDFNISGPTLGVIFRW